MFFSILHSNNSDHMFKRNDSYQQCSLFGIEQKLSIKQLKVWEESIENKFFNSIFAKIDEDQFKVLYSEKKSRPNVPVNQLVGALILRHLYDWTYQELFKHLNFNLLTRHAIGIHSLDEDIFAEATIFNFQNRVIEHFTKTGSDLMNEVFDGLTTGQLEEFGLDCSIQRGDSFLVGSNIVDYSRLQLLIEVLLRLYRTLEEKDQILYENLLKPYTNQSSGNFINGIKRDDLPNHLDRIANLYHTLYLNLKHEYKEVNVFKIFERVYLEHFAMIEEGIAVKDASDLGSDILMSPDDVEATFTKKGNVMSKGYRGHISETANADNAFNLITDIALCENNIGDAQLLEERLPKMMKKTPDLDEYYTDGLYGSPANDLLLEEYQVTHFQTAVRGRKSHTALKIKSKKDGSIWMSCAGGQNVEAIKQKNWKVVFDYQICKNCQFAEKCNTKLLGTKRGKPKRTYYFEQKDILSHARFQRFLDLPKEKKNIRANIEATVKEAKRGMKNGKIRVRTKIRAAYYLTFTAIAINLTRIHKFINLTRVNIFILLAMVFYQPVTWKRNGISKNIRIA